MSASESSGPARMPRREAIKWMLTAAAAVTLLERSTGAAPARAELTMPPPAGKGYGTDPDLTKTYKPGELWPLTFNDAQRATAAALCDAIIPADDKGPGAAAVNVQDFIDEWISAPYANHDNDQRVVLEGLAWLDAEAQKRFGHPFTKLEAGQKEAICDDICSTKVAPDFRKAAQFFKKFRDLTAGGYYTTPEGMKDIGYVGNVPLASFDGPPPEVLKQLGLA